MLTVTGILGLQLRNDAATLRLNLSLFLNVISSRNWIWRNRIELRDRRCLSATSIRFTGKKNQLFFFWYTIFWTCWRWALGITVWTRQKVVCPSGKMGIVGLFCTFIELWVALILGNSVVLWCEKKTFFPVGLFYDLSHVLMEHPVRYLVLIAAHYAA